MFQPGSCVSLNERKREHYLSSTTGMPRIDMKVPERLGLTHDVYCSILRVYRPLQVLVPKSHGNFLEDGEGSTHLNNNISSPDPWVSPSKQNAHTARPEFVTLFE